MQTLELWSASALIALAALQDAGSRGAFPQEGLL